MLHRAWGRFPIGLRKRPFDVFVAVFLASAGVYQIVDPNFPEMQQQVISQLLLTTISIYMITAGLVIAWCILHRCKNIIMNMYIEMYAWMFMSAAVLAITIFDIYVGLSLPIYNYALYYAVLWFWILLSIATSIRWIDLHYVLKRVDK